jgi:hypothetical protein
MSIFRKDPNANAGGNTPAPDVGTSVGPDQTANIVAAVVSQVLRQPMVDQEEIERERAKYRRPKESTRAFKAHVRGGLKRKRRAGIDWTGDPQIVNAADLTEAQAIELLNTPHLYVEELTSESKDAVKPAGVASPTGPDLDGLRAPGDAPVPSPGNSPGRRGGDANMIGGMTPAGETPPAPPRATKQGTKPE